MSTTQYLLNAGLLAFVLWANLGTRAVELVGVVVGALLGLVAAALVRVRREAGGELVMHAGTGYAGLWVAVIGGRVAFAYGAEHWFPRVIGEFSMTHRFTGADRAGRRAVPARA